MQATEVPDAAEGAEVGVAGGNERMGKGVAIGEVSGVGVDGTTDVHPANAATATIHGSWWLPIGGIYAIA